MTPPPQLHFHSRPPPVQAPAPVEYTDFPKGVVYRLQPDGSHLEAHMTAGPNGFALAQFPGEEMQESELPNLLLESSKNLLERVAKVPQLPLQKKPSAKKPAEARIAQKPAEGQVAGPVLGAAVVKHRAMWYKNHHRMAVRRLGSKGKQIASFSYPEYDMETHLQVAQELVQALAEGTITEDQTKDAAVTAMERGR